MSQGSNGIRKRGQRANIPTWELRKAYDELGTYAAVARRFGIDDKCVARRLQRACSSLVKYDDGSGEVVLEWEKFKAAEEDTKTALIELAESLAKKQPARKCSFKLPKLKASDFIGLMVLTDLHVGKLSWSKEVGDSWDTSIARQVGMAAVELLLPLFTGCEEVVLVINGDHWHADNRSNQTERSKNVLEVDGRYHRNLDVGVAVIVFAVDELLKRGHKVRLIITPGNHDWHTAVAASRILNAHYRLDKRVEVDMSPMPRKCYTYGKNLLAFAHGDRIAANKWASIIPVDPATGPHWSSCPQRYLFLGDKHHRKSMQPISIEDSCGLHVEYLPALCAADSWHNDSGFIGAGRKMDGMVFHREYGMQARNTVDIAQVKDMAGL